MCELQGRAERTRGGSVVLPETTTADLNVDLATLRQEEMLIDKSIEALQIQVRRVVGPTNQGQIKAMLDEQIQYAYVDKDDILDLESMRDQIVLSVKAQPGTRLEVPDPATVRLLDANIVSSPILGTSRKE